MEFHNMSKKKPENYVDNAKFSAAVGKWAQEAREARSKGLQSPIICDYIVECFYKIAKRYSSKPNFSGYPFKEDMISEAVYTCMKYAHNFDLEKSRNAFSYFTQYTYNAFIQYITKEKKFAAFKFKLVKEASQKLGKNDFQDIDLYDEDNTGIEELEKQEEEIINAQLVPIEQILKEEK